MAFSIGHVLATATPATERIHMHTYRGAYCMPVPVDRPTYSHSTGQRPTAWSQCPQWYSPQPTTINTQSAVPATQTPVHRPLNKQVMSLCRVLYLFYSYTTTLLSDITYSSYINTTLWFTKKLAYCKSAIGDIMSAASTDSSNNKISNLTVMTTHTHTRLMALCQGLHGWAGTREAKPIWILLKQETVSGSGNSWATCKSAPRSRQITMPAPHHSVFYRPDALPAANQQRQSTDHIATINLPVQNKYFANMHRVELSWRRKPLCTSC